MQPEVANASPSSMMVDRAVCIIASVVVSLSARLGIEHDGHREGG
jgi:hypothetical protein